MASSPDTQLEKVIDEVIKCGDFRALEVFLQRDFHEGTSIKCSQHFLTKLDKLVCKSLDKKDSRSASLGLAVLFKCGKVLKLPHDCQGLSGLINRGLLKKMVLWFEKCRQLWIQCGSQWDETLFNLSEDFFEALMVVHDSCKEGTYKITESFLYPVGQLAVDPRIYILIQKEAIRKFNTILDNIPVELKKKKKILTSQEASDIMVKLAGQILEGGDYDLQTALMEALCRIATAAQRKNLADRWFSMEHVACAFVKIRDSEFETDCRKFLNLVNGMQGDRRRVFSYPCLEVYLDKHELLMPADEKLEEFWIDFNLGSRSISFYCSLADEEVQEGQWETICITENEVQSYTVTECDKRHVLKLKLSESMDMGAVEGSSVTIHFSSSLDILQAVQSVYGHSKNKGFVGKTGTSVVKTTVKVIMEENSSQVVPESQLSLGESEKNTVPYLLPAMPSPVQMVTPAKMSECSVIISSAGESVHDANSLFAAKPLNSSSAKGNGKPSLQMVRSCDRKGELLGEQRTAATACSHGTTPNNTISGGMMEQGDPSLQSTASKQGSKNKIGKHKTSIPEAKAVAVVASGPGEELSLELNFVPDTQPRSGSNTSSNWRKLSVSEILTMPTQKINSLPRPEPRSTLSAHQERPSSAQRVSVPALGPVGQKQFCTDLSQRLQQILSSTSKSNQEPVPPEPFETQKKVPDIREALKDKSSADHCASTSCAPPKKQAQRDSLAKGKSKGQSSSEVDATLNKATAKASTSKAPPDRIPPNVKAETSRALSSKEKRDAELAGSMVKLISSRYESICEDLEESVPQSRNPSLVNRPIFNMSWLPTVKREVHGDKSLVKSHSKTTTSFPKQRKDVFTFKPDTPLTAGGKNKTLTNSSAMSSNDSWGRLSTTMKGQPVAKEKRHVKKHLFSDTDTDYATTEISWLRESVRKPKPKVTKYSRQAPVKPKALPPRTSYESPDLPPPSPVKGRTKPSKKRPGGKETVDQPKMTVKPTAASNRAAGRRPQRAAATSTKSYKEPDTDDSQSESSMLPVSKKYLKKIHSEVPEVKKRTSTSFEESADTYSKQDSNDKSALKKPSDFKVGAQPSVQQQRPVKSVPETKKLSRRNVSPAQEQMNALKDSWAACQASSSPSPPFIESMRSAERSDPTLGLSSPPLLSPRGSPLPASPDLTRQDTPSPILLLPKPRSTCGSKGNFKPSSIYTAEKKHSSSKTRSIQPVSPLPSLTPIGQIPSELSRAELRLISLPPSPLSARPLLTSTLLTEDRPSMPSPPLSPFPEEPSNQFNHYGYKLSPVSQASLSLPSSQSSVLSSRAKASPTVLTIEMEESPPPGQDLRSTELHVSGPIRKRSISSSTNSEEEKQERKKSKMRGQHSPRMKPRKLFKSFSKVSAMSEVKLVISSPHSLDIDEDVDSSNDAGNPNSLCQQLSSELKKKFENRNKMMEVYNNQSLKTIQQHFSSINKQVTKYRTQRLEQVQEVLLGEIDKLEHSDSMLKSIEKDLTISWKKQSVAFCSYKELENRRNETLTNALQRNVCHSVDYEEQIFTSQMCLIRKDMMSVQDRLLTQMQEGELQSVKRGLHALFFP